MSDGLSRWDRFLISLAPNFGLRRVRARAAAQHMMRHFEAASVGRRTSGWSRLASDANSAASGPALAYLRAQARDLVRNNPWALHGLDVIETNTVGWGIRPKANGRNAKRVMELWKQWGETKQCDAAGQLTFYGLQGLIMRAVAESGEVLIRRRMRRLGDGLAIPLQLQVLEPDYIDTSIDGIKGPSGGDIIQGVEFDMIGRRVAYWLFDQHPGGRSLVSPQSRRIPADSILHVFKIGRPGQVRGPSWFAPVDVRLHEFDSYEDATLVKQKIAACMTAFVTDMDGEVSAIGRPGAGKNGELLDQMEPGMIMSLPPGRDVTIANPPQTNDFQSFSTTALRGIAAGLGITYEDLTGDYSQVNYSSARMGRLAHQANVHKWRWNMLIPQFCAPAWQWMLDALSLAGEDVDAAPASWTPPPMPMLDPDKEGAAASKAVRTGQMTLDEMVREQGFDPEEHWQEYAESFKRIDNLGIVLDSDPRKTNASGQQQQQPAAAPSSDTAKKATGAKATDKDSAPVVNDESAKDAGSTEATSSGKASSKQLETKVFAYHQPFMKAKEIREGIGLPGNVEDGDLFALEFVAKHGGGKSGPNDGASGDNEDGTSGAKTTE